MNILKNQNKFALTHKARIVIYHFAFWVAYTCFQQLLTIASNINSLAYWHVSVTKNILAACVFYANVFLLFPLIAKSKKKWVSGIIYNVLLIFVNFLLRMYVIRDILPWITHTAKPPETAYQFFILSIGWWMQYTLYALLYYFWQKQKNTVKQLQTTIKENTDLQNKNLQLRHQNLQNEFNYLKAQINPHFLYNTLSYFYTETEQTKPKVAKGIGLLIDIMRYSLHRDAADNNTSLEQEIQHLDNFIELLQLRFNNTLNIQFIKNGDISGWRIPPHLLITLVENANKHGIATEADNPVIIEMYCTPGRFQFKVRNKINPAKRLYEDTGIGLQNIIKRLRIEYKDKAELAYEKKDDFFFVDLVINQNPEGLR